MTTHTVHQHQKDAFFRDGFALLDDVISPERCAQVDAVIDEIYGGWHEKSDGIIGYCTHPGLHELWQEPVLEQIAQQILETEDVVLVASSILHKRPDPDATLTLTGEHVDIMFSREEWDARPHRVMCMLMVMIADLPEGRANTYVRPGSHRQLADWLEQEGQAPVKAHPVTMPNLPDLDWAELVPVVAKAGQALAFNTNVIHCGSPNMDSDARRIMFVNFCPRGSLRDCAPNHDRREERSAWRAMLREKFRPDRRHLLDDDEA